MQIFPGSIRLHAEIAGQLSVRASRDSAGFDDVCLSVCCRCMDGHLSCWNRSLLPSFPLSLSFPVATAAAGFLAYRWSVKSRDSWPQPVVIQLQSSKPAAPRCVVW